MPKNTFLKDIKDSPTTKASLLTEFRRKALHLCALVLPLGYMVAPRKLALLVLAVCAFIVIFADLLKYYNKSFRKTFVAFFGSMLRRKEIKRFTAATYIMSAMLICALAFDKWVAVLVLVFIINGDLAAAIFGKRFGKHRTIGKKTLEGSIAFFLISYASGIALKLLAGHYFIAAPWTALFIGAMSATVVESLPLGIDDNLTVPVLTGLALQMMYIGHF